MIIRTSTVQAGDALEVAYRTWGSSRFGGLPIVPVHGDWSTSAAWTLLASELTERWILSPDLRGRGRTRAPDNNYRVEDLAADLLAFLDAMELRRAHLIGHELGAAVAAELALRAPERVATLTLVALPDIGGTPVDPGAAEAASAWKQDARAFARDQAERAPKAKRDMLWATLLEAGHKQRLSAALAKLEALAAWQPGARLAALPMPRGLVSGALDTRASGAAERAAPIIGCEHTRLEGVGELPALEAPEPLAEVVRSVIAAAPGT